MTIAVGDKGAASAGTTLVTVAYPTVGADAIALLMVGHKPWNSIATANNADWDRLCSYMSGAVANGSGTGSVIATTFWQLGNVSGGASDDVSVTSGSPTLGQIWEITKTKASWARPVGGTLVDLVETGTGVSATGAMLDIIADDFLVLQVVIKDDSPNHTSQDLDVPGCTLGSITWDTKFFTTFGNDMGKYVGTCTVSSGSATGSPTYTATSSVSGASSTAVNLVRLRELDPPPVGSNLTVMNEAIRGAIFS